MRVVEAIDEALQREPGAQTAVGCVETPLRLPSKGGDIELPVRGNPVEIGIALGHVGLQALEVGPPRAAVVGGDVPRDAGDSEQKQADGQRLQQAANHRRALAASHSSTAR